MILFCALAFAACANSQLEDNKNNQNNTNMENTTKVYLTREISPEALDIANYDFMIALNHFKGHPMGGYGGALKNLSIGCASSNGKASSSST